MQNKFLQKLLFSKRKRDTILTSFIKRGDSMSKSREPETLQEVIAQINEVLNENVIEE